MTLLPLPAPRLTRWMDLANLLSAGAALLVASVLLILFQFMSLRGDLVDDLSVQARIIGDNGVAALLFDDRRAAVEILSALQESPGIAQAALFSADGNVIARYTRSGAEPRPADLSPQLLAQGHLFSIDHLQLVRGMHMDGREVGFVLLVASLDQLYARMLGYAGLTLAIALASLLVAYLLVARMRRFVRKAEAHLEYLAHVDPVTELQNRHAFNEQLAAVLAESERSDGTVSLLLIDLDNFKIVNDTLGHHCGDKLLKLVAYRLLECLRSGDRIFRLGGDEFAIILQTAFASDGEGAARKVLAVLAAPFEVDGHEIYVTASVGISRYPEDGRDLETLARNADTAMYQAKGRGKNDYESFHPELDQRVQKRLSLETKLRRALEREELTLHYQPQISLRDNRLVGLEALLRWQQPELGMIGPEEFIPVAEDSGLIVPIGRWVLRSACAQMAAWRDAGLGDVRVSVNLSARQTRDPHLIHDILEPLREYRIAPRQLELEITESVLMDNVHANVSLLHRLQTEGIRLAIDDFGTGYSSMAYLKRLPIDQVKIDRTFVRDIPGDRDDEAITSAIIAMAHNLDLSVVAEGVETEQQLEFLRNAGCDIMQGYYFSEPRRPEQVAVMLRHRSVSAPAVH